MLEKREQSRPTGNTYCNVFVRLIKSKIKIAIAMHSEADLIVRVLLVVNPFIPLLFWSHIGMWDILSNLVMGGQ